jgi:pimeloyl-ACP methyl ester carboxylesterase
LEIEMRTLSLTLLSACLMLVSLACASDREKENRWAEQVVESLLDGEAVYLNDGRAEFLAIETESAGGDLRKAAIVMHGTGVHPDWPTVVLPLRVGLTESGWHTLSIQMPVLANEAEHAEYAAIYDWVPGRLDAAISHLRAKGFEKIVLIAHSQGSTMTAYYLSRPHGAVEGFVAIGMSGGIAAGPMDTLAQLPSIKTPLLDLYGSEDLPEVIDSAGDRATAAGQAGGDYSQQQVAGADHFFDGEETELLEAVNAWLDQRY